MSKTIKKIWIETDIWQAFQTLYPRQASSAIEDYLKMLINQKTRPIAGDKEFDILLQDADQKKKDIQDLVGELQETNARIQAYTLEKRKKAVEEAEAKRMRSIRAKALSDGIKASGVLADVIDDFM